MEYTYTLLTEPNIVTYDSEGNLISGIVYDVWNDSMSDKNIHCTNYEDDGILHIWFINVLSDSDKTILDTIVDNNK